MINRLLEKLAHWYFINYLKPEIDLYLKAQAAKETMPRQRWVGE